MEETGGGQQPNSSVRADARFRALSRIEREHVRPPTAAEPRRSAAAGPAHTSLACLQCCTHARTHTHTRTHTSSELASTRPKLSFTASWVSPHEIRMCDEHIDVAAVRQSASVRPANDQLQPWILRTRRVQHQRRAAAHATHKHVRRQRPVAAVSPPSAAPLREESASQSPSRTSSR